MAEQDGDLQPVASDYIQLIFYAFCFFLGFPLNLVTLLRLIYRYRKTKSRVFLLHINLNITDLMVLLFYCFGRVCWLLTYQWIGGNKLCKLMRFLEALSFSISSNIVVCIALDRALSVIRPLQASTEMNFRIRIMILIAWLIAGAVGSSQIVVWSAYSTITADGNTFTQCVTQWTIKLVEKKNTTADVLHEKLYETVYLISLFWVPLIILLVSYVIILTSIYRNYGSHRGYTQPPVSRLQTDPNAGQSEDDVAQLATFQQSVQVAEERRQKTRHLTLKISVILVTVYIVCWLPYNTLAWWAIVDSTSFKKIADSVYFLHGLVVLNSVINPFIYGRFQLTNCCPTDEDEPQQMSSHEDDPLAVGGGAAARRDQGRRVPLDDYGSDTDL